MAYSKDYEVVKSVLTVDMIEEMANYMNDDEPKVTFTDEQLDELSEMVGDAVQAAIEDFLNQEKTEDED